MQAQITLHLPFPCYIQHRLTDVQTLQQVMETTLTACGQNDSMQDVVTNRCIAAVLWQHALHVIKAISSHRWASMSLETAGAFALHMLWLSVAQESHHPCMALICQTFPTEA